MKGRESTMVGEKRKSTDKQIVMLGEKLPEWRMVGKTLFSHCL